MRERTKDFTCNTIYHTIPVDGSDEIYVWETFPKNGIPEKENAIVVASGFARRMDHFSGLVEYLSTNGFRVIRYDSLHHVGLSSGSIEKFTMSIGRKSLIAVANWMKGRKVNFGILASSLSARIAYASLSEVDISFLITAVGVVNLRHTLEKAFGFDYLNLPIDNLPDDLNFEGHKLGASIFVRDCLDFGWATLDSTISDMKHLNSPFISFISNNDDWVNPHDVISVLSSINEVHCKMYSLLGGSHNLGENLVVLRNFYRSCTKAAIVLNNGNYNIDVDIEEPQFERLTISSVNERRLMSEIENKKTLV